MSKSFVSTDWKGRVCVLTDARTGKLVCSGTKMKDGEVLIGGTAPHKPSSTGRVLVQSSDGLFTEYYPNVFDMKWSES